MRPDIRKDDEWMHSESGVVYVIARGLYQCADCSDVVDLYHLGSPESIYYKYPASYFEHYWKLKVRHVSDPVWFPLVAS